MVPQAALYCAGQVAQDAGRRCHDTNGIDCGIGILDRAPSVLTCLTVQIFGPVPNTVNSGVFATDDCERYEKTGLGHEPLSRRLTLSIRNYDIQYQREHPPVTDMEAILGIEKTLQPRHLRGT